MTRKTDRLRDTNRGGKSQRDDREGRTPHEVRKVKQQLWRKVLAKELKHNDGLDTTNETDTE